MPLQSANRILHVPRRFSQDEWGGTEAVITNLCAAQLAMGMRPEIHTSLALSTVEHESFRGFPISRYKYCYPFLGLSDEEKHQLDKKGGNLLSWSLYRAMRQAQDVRIFHAHVTKRTGASVLKAAKLARRPCVVTLHGNMFDVPKAEAEDVVASQQGHFEWGRLFGAYFGSRRMLEEVDAILCVGYSEYEKAKEVLGSDRVHFLPNGVHPERFVAAESERIKARTELGFASDTFLYGCISRLDPQKNQLLLIEAFSQVAQMNPKAGLLICGPMTNADYAAKLQAACQASGVGDRIRILPPVTPDTEEHRGRFAALDCFVLPSRHEPFGIVVLEAWASGKPVIAANVGGLARLVSHERTGLKIESGQVSDLIQAMSRIAEEPELCRNLVDAAHLEVQHHYTWPQIAQQLEAIYQQVEAKYI
ncbi:glycosyltransferase family 4 protein [Coraliomargarita sp. SDUM461004]|uniref:Glycosyltransferase family 4 protein n=1 Tax=Thalassobacterium sedimentorum TaxID=3041258 RepID=A0ABU1AGF8_9BACT|nr:glycosyltransferase family 4 protein [Coraliomargarita sp. SDUM461004]MDQ8193814.1 glycosyltransferase family 4 protein [Coraliomargarita sp. SDUM461004]